MQAKKEQFDYNSLPTAVEVDIAVAGGSCTGVFAAIRAARAGAKVAIIEPQNRFGGTATAGQVCYWHSLFSFDYSRQIIFGLTQEFLDRMKKRDLVGFWDEPNPSWYANLNTEEMCCELDEMILEAGVIPFLHTRAVGACFSPDGKLNGMVIAGKGGLSVIRAKYFIDCTGDGDFAAFAGAEFWQPPELQTMTTCVKLGKFPRELMQESRLGKMIRDASGRYNMPCGVIWGAGCYNSPSYMLAGTNIPNLDVSDSENLTFAEIESRRQMRAIADIIAEAGYPRPVIEAVPSLVGVRETRHIVSLYRITTDELLSGKRFKDEAGKGTYRCDVHQRNPAGTVFRYLDGTEIFFSACEPDRVGRWRDESLPTPEYYTWPLRSQIPAGLDNLITAGRMIDAESGAFGALRVMVNTNQAGESAGAAAAEAWLAGISFPELVQRKLSVENDGN